MEEKLTVFQLEPGKIYKRGGYSLLYKITENKELLHKRQDYGYGDFEPSNIRYNDAVKALFTEIKREIDWTKVPRMTKVQVRDYDSQEWQNKYFCSYKSDTHIVYATAYHDDNFAGIRQPGSHWEYCRIHPSVEIPDEWYKEV